MIQIQLFFMVFVVVLLVYEFILLREYKNKKTRKRKKKRKKTKEYPMEVKILKDFYHLDITQLNYNRLLHFIAIVSSLDIAIIVTIAGLFKSGIIQILIAFILVLPVIFSSYYLIYLYYQYKLKKRRKKDE